MRDKVFFVFLSAESKNFVGLRELKKSFNKKKIQHEKSDSVNKLM